MVARAGAGEWGVSSRGAGCLGGEHVLELGRGAGRTAWGRYQMSLNCTLRNGTFYVICVSPQFKKMRRERRR